MRRSHSLLGIILTCTILLSSRVYVQQTQPGPDLKPAKVQTRRSSYRADSPSQAVVVVVCLSKPMLTPPLCCKYFMCLLWSSSVRRAATMTMSFNPDGLAHQTQCRSIPTGWHIKLVESSACYERYSSSPLYVRIYVIICLECAPGNDPNRMWYPLNGWQVLDSVFPGTVESKICSNHVPVHACHPVLTATLACHPLSSGGCLAVL